MPQDELIRRHADDLRSRHGPQAIDAAEARMRQEMDKGDMKEAGIWLSVMYELTRADAEKARQ